MSSPRASIASSQPDQRHLRLIAAAAQANEVRVRDILDEEPPWTSSADLDAVRQALQKVAGRGKLSVVRLLIERGAEVNPKRDVEVPAIIKAAEGGNVDVVSELLAHHADPNAPNRSGQTALFSAAIKGHDKVVEALLKGGADANAKDKEGRSALLYLASEKQAKAKWTTETLSLLHNQGHANIEVRDQIGRTPLLWAATNSNIALARFLLERGADVTATNNRRRTALHLSAESNDDEHRDDMIRLLLSRGADPGATSDGGWTPLHNAAQKGYLSVAKLLLDAGADVNAELSNGMMPLHWAAFNGFEDFVRLLLSRSDVHLTIKDAFDRTPLLCAAEKHHANIVRLLSPAQTASRLSELERSACKAFEATVVDFGQFEKKQLVSKYSVYDLLYGWNAETDKPLVPTLTKNIRYKPDFRWIHLPANNIAWVETLLAKSFIEAGHRDIESFKALGKCFDQEHRGYLAHARFMRTFCHRIPAPRRDETDRSEKRSTIPPENASSEPDHSRSAAGDGANPRNGQDNIIASESETKKSKKSKAEQIAERHPKKHKRAKGPPGNPPQRQENSNNNNNNNGSNGNNNNNSSSSAMATSHISGGKGASLSVPWDTPHLAPSHGKIVLFMPFLHYETDERRKKMSDTIRCVRERELQSLDNYSKDSLLINAYLNGTPPLHPRRTLDQFFYLDIDTSARDTDQVVYRFCKRHKIETKVFMVDQLWLWVIGKDLVITCFPQRWDQPKNDPMNVLEGIIEETNAKTRPPIQSVYDLAMLITSRCSGMFDRSRLDDRNYRFLEMFENSIGVITDRESQLFSRFNRASAQSAQWLQRHRRQRNSTPILLGTSETDASSAAGSSAEQLTDVLLNIGHETSLLAEIKDIRDELNIIKGILDAQLQTINYLEGFVTEELRGKHNSRRSAESVVWEVRRRTGEQRRGLDAKLKDVSRMDSQAFSLYTSLTDLLDLKQKHSNALEARFAGDQALIAAKQGQTVMMFTIVTIIFQPLSFIASFFAINFVEWQRALPLSIPFVSKYLFGIGFAISIPLIALAFTAGSISNGAASIFGRARGAVVDLMAGRIRGGKSDADDYNDDGDGDGDGDGDDPGEKGTRSKDLYPMSIADLPAITIEKTEYAKPSFSARREEYYQPPPSRRGDRDWEWDGGHAPANTAWMRPSFQSREQRSGEYYGRGRGRGHFSPVSAHDHGHDHDHDHDGERRRVRLGNHVNIARTSRGISFERDVGPGSSRGLSEDLESGRFRLA
ncbi:hypothetical protein GGR50DRAFT_605239 [Xylaria sp. CBS 124048]|nr:hypothetical protein GGR50DRAFT_605239 [Xylaria sp. CBS 124048]